MTSPTYSVEELRAKLSGLDARILKAEAALDAATRNVELLRTQRVGAAAFLDMLDEPERPARQTGSVSTGNSAVIREILFEHPDGIDIGGIMDIAVERGHSFDREQVRSAVTYLRRTGIVESETRGVWRPKKVASDTDSVHSMFPEDDRTDPVTVAAVTGIGA